MSPLGQLKRPTPALEEVTSSAMANLANLTGNVENDKNDQEGQIDKDGEDDRKWQTRPKG